MDIKELIKDNQTLFSQVGIEIYSGSDGRRSDGGVLNTKKRENVVIVTLLAKILEQLEIMNNKDTVVDEKEEVKAKLKKAGIKFSANTSLEKLKEKLPKGE